MMDIHRSYFYYESVKDDSAVEEAIRKASEHGDGFWKIFEIIRRDGHTWNHKKVYRVYKAMHYEKRKRLKKRLPARVKNPLEQPMEPFVTWSIDFVSDVLEKVIWLNGKPRNIRCDNGPEFIAKEFQEWCAANDIRLLYTQPGCPTQNGYIERFNGSYRRAVLDAYIFRTIDEVRMQTEAWRNYYNKERPHESLNNMTPYEYRELKEKDDD